MSIVPTDTLNCLRQKKRSRQSPTSSNKIESRFSEHNKELLLQQLPKIIPYTTYETSEHTALAAFLPPYPHTQYAAQCRVPIASATYPATLSASDTQYLLASPPAHTHYRANRSYRHAVAHDFRAYPCPSV